MARPDPRNIIGKVPGRFCIGPTDLSADFPHGGTALGESYRGRLVYEAPKQVLTAEERGNQPYEVIHGGESWALAGTLRADPPDTYAKLFLNASTGATSGRPLIEAPGTNRAGEALSGRAVVLCFAPFEVDRHPFVLLYKAIPLAEDTQELSLNLGGSDEEGFGVPYVFLGTLDDSDRLIACGARADITL